MKVRFCRSTSFSASHVVPGVTSRDGTGREFVVEAHFEGPVHPLTGMIVNLVVVDAWLEGLIAPLRNRRLNDVPAFAGRPATSENLALFLATELTSKVEFEAPGVSLRKFRLKESNDTWIDLETSHT